MSSRGTTTGPTAEMARLTSRIVCVEDFIRDMENRGEDGYFVSSKWLLSLQEHETESLMSVLRRAGYSGTYQTPTTTLFARIQKDDQYGITYNDVPGTSTDTAVRPGDSEVVRYSPKWGNDPSVEIAGKTLKNIDLNIDLNPGIADISKSETLLLQTVSSKDYGGSILAAPSEAESTPGNVLQQLQNVPREQYEASDFRIAEANAKDIRKLIPAECLYKSCRQPTSPKPEAAVHRSEGLPTHVVELERRAQEVEDKLKDASVLGICGMGGIGKTTLAKQVYNNISSDFKYTCFMDNVKGIQIHKLEKWLLTQFNHCGTKMNESNTQWLSLKDQKILIVMDDVDSEDQLKILPTLQHFGNGSRLIITSRDRQIFKFYDQFAVQEVNFLQRDVARKFFCYNAFSQEEVPRHLPMTKHLKGYVQSVVDKCGGLPLTLEVMGHYLRGHETNGKMWEETINKLSKAQAINGSWNDGVWASLRVASLRDELRAQLQELKVEGEEFGAPLQAHLRANLQSIPKEEERRLLEQRYTEKQPGTSYQKTIVQEQIGNLLYLKEIEESQERDEEESHESDEEETLPGIGEHQGATWKSFKVPPQSSKEEPHQSLEEEETLPGVGEHQGATWKSFKAALQSKIHQSFCVSTQWLSNFKDHEDEALKAGYETISQTKTATWYQKSRDHHVKSPAGGACDDDSYKVSNRNDGVDGGVNEPGASKSGNFLGQSRPRQSVDNTNCSRDGDVEHKTSSFDVATEMKRTWVQHVESTCHPQLLRVECSSPSHTRTELSPNGHFHKQQFGDSVVTMPGSEAQNISTTIEKPFSVMTIDFSGDGRGREVPVDLKAIATTSLSCCLKDGHDSSKVRIKFSRISGDVKTDDSYEESCNAMVLRSSYTSVYGCIRSNIEDGFEEINLNLEDEYHNPPRRRVLASAPRSSGELATTSVDLVWLEISGRTPNNCEPGSVTLALRGDIAERRKEDSLRQFQGVHPLLFKEPRPVIFGGDITLPPHWFLEFRIRSQLEVSYFKPWTPISEEGPVWPASDTTKVIDFGCCFALRAEDLRLHSKKRRKREILGDSGL